ncbi:MAG: adenylyltransferase/cytidyltransferase family protein [Patescibacteria group bacterium]|nr:adenylyltransferase/cytidyltransferase family protein [Patescibacteria group bacterium]
MPTVAVSGGFDPIHIGHIELLKEAKALGDKLVVILNNDNWLKKKKGFAFMTEAERKAILEAVRYVDAVMISEHPQNPADMSVSEMLLRIKPDIFANGGDRNETDAANPQSSLYKDIHTCEKLGIKIVYNVGKSGKIQSSSDLVRKVRESTP